MEGCLGEMYVLVMFAAQHSAMKFLLKFCIIPITFLIGLEGTFQKIIEGRVGYMDTRRKGG